MNEIIYTAIRLVVMVTAVVVAKYLIPWLNSNVNKQALEEIIIWTNHAVLCAQQLMSESASGAERKQAVMTFLRRLMDEKGINITDEQLDTLIESAVKNMKISEGR